MNLTLRRLISRLQVAPSLSAIMHRIHTKPMSGVACMFRVSTVAWQCSHLAVSGAGRALRTPSEGTHSCVVAPPRNIKRGDIGGRGAVHSTQR